MASVFSDLIFAPNTIPLYRRVASAIRGPSTVVVPVATLPPIEVRAVPPILPDEVDLDKASGGFNSVAQFSAPFCLRVFDSRFSEYPFTIPVLPSELQEALNADPRPFATPYLNALRQQGVGSSQYILRLIPFPISLEFVAPAFVSISYQIGVRLELKDSSSTSSQGFADSPLAALLQIGFFTLRLRAPYVGSADSSMAGAAVFVDVRQAEVESDFGDGDVQRLRTSLRPFKVFDVFSYVLSRAEKGVYPGNVPLAPSISLVGDRGFFGDLSVTEFDEKFEIETFHVGVLPWQALVVAFDVRQGCNGRVESVQFFVGDQDYAVITDEYVMYQMLHYRFRRGDFPKELNLHAHVPLIIDGKPLGATIYGLMVIESVDAVSVELDANARNEVLTVDCGVKSEPFYIFLDDGREIQPSDVGTPLDIAFGEVRFFTHPVLSDNLSSDPQVQHFQIDLHYGAYTYLTKPFGFPDQVLYGRPDQLVQVTYVRLTSYTSQIIAFGVFPDIHSIRKLTLDL